MKQTSNTFNDGLLLDYHPLLQPNTSLSNALNATFITMNGNEMSLQNDMGNVVVEKGNLPTGFIPIGAKEYGGIIYLASINLDSGECQIGSYPSPEQNFDNKENNKQDIIINEILDFNRENKDVQNFSVKKDLGFTLTPGDQIVINCTNNNESELQTLLNKGIITLDLCVMDSGNNLVKIDDQDSVVVYKYKSTTELDTEDVINIQKGVLLGYDEDLNPHFAKNVKVVTPGGLQEFDDNTLVFKSYPKWLTFKDEADWNNFNLTEGKIFIYNKKISGKAYLVCTINTIVDCTVDLQAKKVQEGYQITPKVIYTLPYEATDAYKDYLAFPKLTISNIELGKATQDGAIFTWDPIVIKDPEILQVTVTPYMDLKQNNNLVPINSLIKTFDYDLSYVGTGELELDNYLYTVDEDKINLNISFISYPDDPIRSIYLVLYKIISKRTEDNKYVTEREYATHKRLEYYNYNRMIRESIIFNDSFTNNHIYIMDIVVDTQKNNVVINNNKVSGGIKKQTVWLVAADFINDLEINTNIQQEYFNVGIPYMPNVDVDLNLDPTIEISGNDIKIATNTISNGGTYQQSKTYTTKVSMSTTFLWDQLFENEFIQEIQNLYIAPQLEEDGISGMVTDIERDSGVINVSSDYDKVNRTLSVTLPSTLNINYSNAEIKEVSVDHLFTIQQNLSLPTYPQYSAFVAIKNDQSSAGLDFICGTFDHYANEIVDGYWVTNVHQKMAYARQVLKTSLQKTSEYAGTNYIFLENLTYGMEEDKEGESATLVNFIYDQKDKNIKLTPNKLSQGKDGHEQEFKSCFAIRNKIYDTSSKDINTYYTYLNSDYQVLLWKDSANNFHPCSQACFLKLNEDKSKEANTGIYTSIFGDIYEDSGSQSFQMYVPTISGVFKYNYEVTFSGIFTVRDAANQGIQITKLSKKDPVTNMELKFLLDQGTYSTNLVIPSIDYSSLLNSKSIAQAVLQENNNVQNIIIPSSNLTNTKKYVINDNKYLDTTKDQILSQFDLNNLYVYATKTKKVKFRPLLKRKAGPGYDIDTVLEVFNDLLNQSAFKIKSEALPLLDGDPNPSGIYDITES